MKVVATLTIVIAIGVIATAAAARASTNNFHKFGSVEDLADAIHDKKFEDDSINWKDYKEWVGFILASQDVKDCLKHRHDLSNNLADYEVYNCYDENDNDDE